MPDGPFCCMMPKFGNDDYSSGPDERACAPVFAVSNATGPYNIAPSRTKIAPTAACRCPGRKHADDIEPTTTKATTSRWSAAAAAGAEVVVTSNTTGHCRTLS